MRIQYIKETIDAEKLVANKSMSRRLVVAWRHDSSIPRDMLALHGPRPDDSRILVELVRAINAHLRDNLWGDLSRDNKMDEWMLSRYANHVYDYEDIGSVADGRDSVADTLGQWRALSIRGRLRPHEQDLNRFPTVQQVQRVLNSHRDELDEIKDAAHAEQARRGQEETVLIDNDKFWVAIPYNYGACYTFNFGMGHQSNFCTGSSGGEQWFRKYAPEGPIVQIVHKPTMNEPDGKWQFHAPTDQLVNSVQANRGNTPANDRRFAQLFPDLMYEILSAMNSKRSEIEEKSQAIVKGGYNVPRQIEMIKSSFPISWDNPDNPIEQSPLR